MERDQCFVFSVTFLVSLPGTIRTFFAGSSKGSWRVPGQTWIELDWLHSVPVAGSLCCLDHSVLKGAVITPISDYLI